MQHWPYGTSGSGCDCLRPYGESMEARATAKAWFKIERNTAYALAVVAACLLLAAVVAAWTASTSRVKQNESAEGP